MYIAPKIIVSLDATAVSGEAFGAVNCSAVGTCCA